MFRACAVRQAENQDLKNPDSPSRGVQGAFSQVLTIKTQTLRCLKRTSVRQSKIEEFNDFEQRKPLTDFQWAMIFFIGFALFALGLAFIAPVLFDLSG